MSVSGTNQDPYFMSTSQTEEKPPADAARAGDSAAKASGAFKPPISGLKDMSPEDWQKELELIAQNFCNEFKKRSDRVVREMKKHRQS